jgi:hypothetical protein
MTAEITRDNHSTQDAGDDLAGIDAAFHFGFWASEKVISASTTMFDAI